MWRVKIFGLLYLFKVFKKNTRQSLTMMSWGLKVKQALMSKQINFYATEVDKMFLEELLKEVFGEMLDVPSPKEPLAPFPPVLYNSSSFYLVERSRKEDLVYYTHAYYTGKIISVLDTVNSPVLEYSPAGVNATEGYYLQGRFYTRAKDKELTTRLCKHSLLEYYYWFLDFATFQRCRHASTLRWFVSISTTSFFISCIGREYRKAGSIE